MDEKVSIILYYNDYHTFICHQYFVNHRHSHKSGHHGKAWNGANKHNVAESHIRNSCDIASEIRTITEDRCGTVAISFSSSNTLLHEDIPVIYVMTNLLIVVFALVAAFVLSCLKEIHSHSCEGNESDGRKLNENKRYRKAAYVLIAMFEMANLINLIVLIA
ncbi:unnamed protein product [Cylicostephanus goldi]|uniref:Uncharacterized protein n=1 Tax=Cylicostephanus goldi TaxID=71465 RepID=A0A3P6RHI5_CYLGO|nr:unnamed protein product [Cylicostephanus goldi]